VRDPTGEGGRQAIYTSDKDRSCNAKEKRSGRSESVDVHRGAAEDNAG
jgi:hypothetical protein